MCFEKLSPELQSAIVSGAIGLLGALVGALAAIGSTYLAKKLQAAGKVSLYARIVHSKGSVNPACGYYKSGMSDGLVMRVPLWIDIMNTCGISRIVRDLSMHAYLDEEEIATFTQIQSIGDGDDAILLGNEGAYTFVIPANGACRFDLEYMLKEVDVPEDKKQFDALIMTYFDEKNGIHKFHLMDIEGCWSLGEIKTEKKWIALTTG